jgi:hypothetical protein
MYSLEELQKNEKAAYPDKDIEVIRNEILKRAKIICSTLSVTGSNVLTSFNQVYFIKSYNLLRDLILSLLMRLVKLSRSQP